MLSSQPFPGAWYGDALPSGEFAILFKDSHILTHLGRVELPVGTWGKENVLFLRISNANGFKLAGQGHGTGWAWLWDGTWQTRGATYGVSPLIFDNAGTLLLATPANGSQGYRYIDANGVAVTGDATYANPALELGEFTVLGDVIVGQHGYSCAVHYNAQLHTLALGNATFIRAYRQSDRFTVTVVQDDATRVFSFSLSDIAALPLAVAPVSLPGPTFPVPIFPKEPLKTMPTITDTQFAALDQMRQALNKAVLTPEEGGALINAWTYRFKAEGLGMQAKPSGTASIQPRTGVHVWNGVRFQVGGKHYGEDVFGSASIGLYTPVRGDAGDADPNTFVAPVAPEAAVVVVVPVEPTPLPTTVDFTTVLAALTTVNTTINACSVAEIAKLDELKVAVIKAAGELAKALPSLGGLGGLLGRK